jgi:hypothetical protein
MSIFDWNAEFTKWRRAGRPTLEKLFARRTSDKTTRDHLIEKAVNGFGYSQFGIGSVFGPTLFHNQPNTQQK